MIARSLLSVLLVVVLAVSPVVRAFSVSPVVSSSPAEKTRLYTKKYPQGRPCTIQEDEDAAMWIESKDGKREKALKKPVGGRPINKYTRDMVEKIEKKGVPKKPWWQF